MATKNTKPTATPHVEKAKAKPADAEEVLDSAIGKIELFFEKNSKTLVTILAAIVVVVGGYFGYKYLYMQPRGQRAANMIFVAEQQFAIDSFSLALNGDGNNAGFLQVIDKFGSTAPGNMAKHYAGICYLRLGNLDKAMQYLQSYSQMEGAPARVVNSQNYGLQGDILSQKGDYQGAAAKYKAASEVGGNSFTTPYYLRKLGLMCQLTNKSALAIAAYQRIQREFPQSMEARDIDKFIGEASQGNL